MRISDWSSDVCSSDLFKPNRELRPHSITIPLDIHSPEAITALAGTITMTPGTLSADVSADGRALLVHCLDTGDPAGEVTGIKQRYEADRNRVVSGKSVSVRVDLVGRRNIKNKT